MIKQLEELLIEYNLYDRFKNYFAYIDYIDYVIQLDLYNHIKKSFSKHNTDFAKVFILECITYKFKQSVWNYKENKMYWITQLPAIADSESIDSITVTDISNKKKYDFKVSDLMTASDYRKWKIQNMLDNNEQE